MKVVVGTRGSELAVRQAEPLVDFLVQSGASVTWKRFTTQGDAWLAGPLDQRVGTGFFTKELEEALLSREVDLLIHSYKDVALQRPSGIVPACIPRRSDPSDWLILRPDAPERPTLGTSAERRRRFLERALPDATFTWIRGNVPTRLQRLREGRLREGPLHGIVLAAAGLTRLGLDLTDFSVRPLHEAEILPAPAQGALLAETRSDRPDLVERLQGFQDPATARCVALERAVLAGIGGGCQQPLGALATLDGDRIHLRAAYAGPEGIRRAEAEGVEDRVVLERVLRELGW